MWKHTSNGSRGIDEALVLPSSIRVLTWNVDFSERNPRQRLQRALEHIQHDVFLCKGGEKPAPCCILLQEVKHEAFRVIMAFEWFRDYFVMAPMSPEHWPLGADYGTVTLVSRTVPVSCAHTIEFSNSEFTRNALFVDVKLSVPSSYRPKLVTLRIGNTHLESLTRGTSKRPQQLELIADFLQEEGVHGAVVCGDMNAIAPSDMHIPAQVGLCDAWQSGEDTEVGYTWGYQTHENRYPAGRLDKMLYVARNGYMLEEPRCIGVGVRTTQGQWASDHYGLITTVHIISG